MERSVFQQQRQLCENAAHIEQTPTRHLVEAISEAAIVKSSDSSLKSLRGFLAFLKNHNKSQLSLNMTSIPLHLLLWVP